MPILHVGILIPEERSYALTLNKKATGALIFIDNYARMVVNLRRVRICFLPLQRFDVIRHPLSCPVRNADLSRGKNERKDR